MLLVKCPVTAVAIPNSVPLSTHTHLPLHIYHELAKPDRNGVPINDLSSDEQAVPGYTSVCYVLYTSENEAKLDRVLTKVIKE